MQNRPNPNAPRRMSRQQYEALMRQRRQNRIAIAIIAVTASGVLGRNISTTAITINTAMAAMTAMATRFWRRCASYSARVMRRGADDLGLFCICNSSEKR